MMIFTESMRQFAHAFIRVKARFDKEGPFVFDLDDADGIMMGGVGQRVVYVDDGSIFMEKVA